MLVRRAAWPLAASCVLATILVLDAAAPARADGHVDAASGWVDGANDGTTATGSAHDVTPESTGSDGSGTGSGEPNCTMSDGTPAYLSFEPLKWTTMEDQRTEIRPEEQRPGVYLHRYCGGEWVDFDFYPEGDPVDPEALARNVRITPASPVLVTSPPEAEGLVGIDAWFWLEGWGDASASATAGDVTVTVHASPQTLTVDPGDGTGVVGCAGPPVPYSPGADPAEGCTHVYESAGVFTATATLTYDVGFTSNVGDGGSLGTITTVGSVEVTVREAQAVVSG